jgi:hypothetical protein
LDVAAVEDPARHNILCQNETVTVNSPPPRNEISLQEIPVSSEETEESHSMDVQDCDRQEKEYLKESQSTVIHDVCLGSVITKARRNLNMKEMLRSVGRDERSSDSSIDVPGSSTHPVIHFPDTVKDPSDTNDNEAATDNNEADIFVSIIRLTNDCP